MLSSKNLIQLVQDFVLSIQTDASSLHPLPVFLHYSRAALRIGCSCLYALQDRSHRVQLNGEIEITAFKKSVKYCG